MLSTTWPSTSGMDDKALGGCVHRPRQCRKLSVLRLGEPDVAAGRISTGGDLVAGGDQLAQHGPSRTISAYRRMLAADGVLLAISPR